jgi:hypothetical protein
MWKQPENDHFVQEIYLAGERVRPGLYRQVGSPREIRLDREDNLPASMDGRVACYVRIDHTWAQIQQAAPSGMAA